MESDPNNLHPKGAPPFSAQGFRFGIVVSRYHEGIGQALLEGATHFLVASEVRPKDLKTYFVPGAFEMPLMLKRLAASRKFDALVALGVVIRGETAHFDYVAGEASLGIAQVAYDFEIPIGFGLLTTFTEEQAFERAGGEYGNKGEEAAAAALEMIYRLEKL